MQGQSRDAGFRVLMATVIARAVDDLRSADPKLRAVEKDQAMAFILSEACEAWCIELGIDYEAVKKKAAAQYRRIIEGDLVFTPRRSLRVTPSAKSRTCPTTAKGRQTQ
jgi:hypothetical protein